MVEIDLDHKSTGKYGRNDSVSATRETYSGSDLFFVVTHTEVNNQSTKSGADITYLKFKSTNNDLKANLYQFYEMSTFKNVEVFYSIFHNDNPLVLGINTSSSRYHKFSVLKNKKVSPIRLDSGWFGSDKLIDNLIEENNDQNNVITYRLDQQLTSGNKYNDITVTKNTENSFLKYTHEPYVDYKNNSAYLLFKGHLLKLQPNYELSAENKLDTLENKKYCKLNVYYSTERSTQPPLYLELFENKRGGETCRSTETEQPTNSISYWLQRVDPEGHHWKQGTKNDENLGPGQAQEIFKQITTNDKNSIMVQINQQGGYNMDLIKHYRFDGIGEPTKPYKTIFGTHKPVSNFNYQYYEHDFSGSKSLEASNIDSLRTFIGNAEIKLYGNSEKIVKLYYEPKTDDTKKIQIFFYVRDKVPLMLIYDYKPYSSTKKEYFRQWTQIRDLTTPDPTEDSSSIQIKKELDKINKQFNEILLEKTSSDGYGISPPPSGQTLSGFDTTRVKVEQTGPSTGQKFGKVTHSTSNKSSIGKVVYNGHEIQDDKGKNISQTLESDKPPGSDLTTVTVYYYKHDPNYMYQLLLAFGTNTGTTLYYQRHDRNRQPTTKWKRVPEPESATLRSEAGLEAKINKIKYEINQSIKIQLEKDSTANSNNYSACVIENTGSTTTGSFSTGTINVTDDSFCIFESRNYKCYKHSVKLTEINKPEICWLRFFLYNVEIAIYNSDKTNTTPIFYQQGHNDVYVYFYNESPVPLLLRYNGQSFKPADRNNYFYKWISQTILSGSNPGQSDLDVINRSLNDIELAETTNTKNGKTYGIIKPGKDPPQELGEDFYGRINVTVCVTTNYRKLTHSTTNKFDIGSILFRGNHLSSIQIQYNENEVSVYYESCDKKFLHPLLLEVKSSSKSINSSWYYRSSTDGLKWSNQEDPNKYVKGSKIKNELTTIRSRLLIYFTIRVEQHRINYKTKVSDNFYNNSKSKEASISVDTIGTLDDIRVTNYHTYSHRLITYYRENKDQIKTNFDQSEDNFPLCLRVTIIDRDLDLIGNNGMFVTLIYKDDRSEKKHDVEVYYHQDESDPYEIPLLIKFGKKIFAPKNKDLYFSKWDEIVGEKPFTSSNPNDLKKELDNIYSCLNAIDLSKTSSYGISCCKTHAYYNHKSNKFSTKRVAVTKYTNTGGYYMNVHKTVNNTKIGVIQHSNKSYNFNQHTYYIPSTQIINEVAVVFKTSNSIDTPILVLLNEKPTYGDSSTTYGYYYQDDARGDMHTTYKFYPISGGCKMMDKLKGIDDPFGKCLPEQIKHIKETWDQITTHNMIQAGGSPADDIESVDCDSPVHNEFDLDKCFEDDRADDSTDTGSESSPERQDYRTKVSSPLGIDAGGQGPEIQQAPSVGSKESQEASHNYDGDDMKQQESQVPQVNGDLSGSQTDHETTAGREVNRVSTSGQTSDMGQDDRPKVGLGAPDGGGQGLGGSGGVDSGAKAGQGAPGLVGPAGNDGAPGEKGETGEQGRTEASAPGPGHPTTTGNEDQSQSQQPRGGGGNSGRQDSEASPSSPKGAKGEKGDRGEPGSSSAISSSSSGSSSSGSTENQQKPTYLGEPTIDNAIHELVTYTKKNPEVVYGSSSAVAGVGVIGGVGAVVYKKCVAYGTTNTLLNINTYNNQIINKKHLKPINPKTINSNTNE